MAEAFEQFKQFEYKNNSNLVLQRESGSSHTGPTGEPESLVGRLPGKMGDKRMLAKIPPELLKSMSTYVAIDGQKVRSEINTRKTKKRRLQNVLEQLEQTSANVTTATDEPVAVVFENTDSSSSSDNEDDSDNSSSGEELGDGAYKVFSGGGGGGDESGTQDLPDEENHFVEATHQRASDTTQSINVRELTAHWLQGQLTERTIVEESDVAQSLLPTEARILEALALPDLQECEAELVDIIGVDHFDFIALLLHNRSRVFYLTKLCQAQTDEERLEIENSMKQSVDGRQALKELRLSRQAQNKEAAFEETIGAEAARLTKEMRGDEPSHADEDMNMAEPSEVTPSIDVLNLESLSFKTADKLTGVDKVKLPKGTERVSSKDWEEVMIPERTRVTQMNETVDVEKVIPKWALPSFTDVGIKRLNPIQTKVSETALNDRNTNMLISAPTGAGKTNIAIMAILEVIGRYVTSATDSSMSDNDSYKCALNQFKIIYISPMKALVAEQVSAFKKRLDALNLGIRVSELTGDINLSQAEIESTQIIVTTPEKWDVITRKSGERSYTQLVRLMIFDEIHLLHDKRGAVIEALAARALRQYEATGQHIRFVGLSATLPNASDVAIFLRVPQDKGLFVFGAEYRPVPLRQIFVGIKTKSSMKRYEKMNEICYDRLMQYAGQHQVLIFCHSRKETVRTAKYLRDRAFQSGEITKFFSEAEADASKEVLASEKNNVISTDLKDLITFGFGVHHAGMQRSDRKLVEDLFADKHLQVIVSTATLAWGVNLPAHAVIIKGTQIYSPDQGAWTELPPLDVIQMIGRAGRPPFDKFGEGIIITQQSQLQYYVSLTNQQLPVESQLIDQLPEILNAEIALGSIRTRAQAADWLLYTYLFVRMKRQPKLYHVPEDLTTDLTFIQWRTDLIHAALIQLDTLRLINYDQTSGKINATALSKAASNYYLRPKTIAILNQSLTSEINDIDLLRIFGHVQEFSNMPVRPEEKPELSKCIDRVPIPVKGQISEPATKINILLQAYISGLKLDGFALQADMSMVIQNAARILRAIFEIALRRGWARVTELSLTYAKVVDRRMWNSMSPLRQFGVLSLGDLRRIETRNIPWSAYFDMTEGELGELLKNQQLGKRIWKLLRQFPKLNVECFILPVTDKAIQIDMTITADFEWNKKISRSAELFWIFIENVDRTKILYADAFILKRSEADREHYITFTVQLDEPRSPNHFVKVISDRWLGSERIFPISFKDLIIPSKNPPPTTFLGLQPIPISAINFPEAVKSLYPNLEFFTSLQSQVFQPLYSTDHNVLICAPHTSGRSVMAELAILRLLMNSKDPSCVYLTPNEAAARSRYNYLKKRFGSLGLTVSILTGNLVTDTKLVGRTHILIARASHWEAVSRRWRVRKSLQNIGLLLIESIELLGDQQVGSDLEVGLSRMRLMTDLLQGKEKATTGGHAGGGGGGVMTTSGGGGGSGGGSSSTTTLHRGCCGPRIVALGAPIGNAIDLADWLGASGQLYNFHPTVRSTALDLSITRIDLPDRTRRLIASYSFMGYAIKRAEEAAPHDHQEPSIIVICTERREARQTCIELLLQAAAEHKPLKYLRGQNQEKLQRELASISSQLHERVLGDIMSYGVGLIHEGMSEWERDLVYSWYGSKKLSVLVMTYQLIYEIHLTADLVIVQDTEIWDNIKKRWTKYSSEILTRFLGLAEPSSEYSSNRSPKDSTQNPPPSTSAAAALILCKPARHEEIKRCIFEPCQVESNVDLSLPDHLLSEIVTGTIHNKQECIDWFTWTLAYRRLLKNPNFYGLRSSDELIVSEYISEVIEGACENLQKAGCIEIDSDDVTLTPTNLGLVAVFYALRAATVEGFIKLLSDNSGIRQILTAICSAKEIMRYLQIRHGEEMVLETLAEECGLTSAGGGGGGGGAAKSGPPLSNPTSSSSAVLDYTDPYTKALILLNAHIMRLPLTPDLKGDLDELLIIAEKCCHALIDVLSSTNRLRQLLGAGELCQMITQGCQPESLLQLPHIDEEKMRICKEKYKIMNCMDILNAEDDVRDKLFEELKLDPAAVEEIAEVCNSMPVLSLKIISADSKAVQVQVSRDLDEDETDVGQVTSLYFPIVKEEQWWLIVATSDGSQLMGLRRTTLNSAENYITIDIDKAAIKSSPQQYKLFCVSDSHIGCDRECNFTLSDDPSMKKI